MSLKLEALEAEVLRLSPSDRTHLLERIIVSLDTDAEVEDAWLREAAHRQTEVESGTVALIPGKEAMDRLRTRLKR